LEDRLAILTNHTNKRFLLRHVQPDILFHCGILDWGVIPSIVAMPSAIGRGGNNYVIVRKTAPHIGVQN
jgi:hypothetical protein